MLNNAVESAFFRMRLCHNQMSRGGTIVISGSILHPQVKTTIIYLMTESDYRSTT